MSPDGTTKPTQAQDASGSAATAQPPVLVTDASDAAGVGDGEFVLGGQVVDVRDGEARLRSTGS